MLRDFTAGDPMREGVIWTNLTPAQIAQRLAEKGTPVSVPVVRVIGLCFMALGMAAIVTPAEWGNVWLAVGFGGLQIGFGIYIARNHGG